MRQYKHSKQQTNKQTNKQTNNHQLHFFLIFFKYQNLAVINFRSKCRKQQASRELLRRYIQTWKILIRVNLTFFNLIFLMETESHIPFIKSLVGASVPPGTNPMFGPQCQAESRGVIKNLILVGLVEKLILQLTFQIPARHVVRFLPLLSVMCSFFVLFLFCFLYCLIKISVLSILLCVSISFYSVFILQSKDSDRISVRKE